MIKIQIDLPETRKNKILKSLITSRENFFKYLNFLLSDNPYLEESALGNGGGGDPKPPGSSSMGPFIDLPIFEHLLTSASRNTKKLEAIDMLVRRLTDEDLDKSEKIIPDEFCDFWNVFKQVAGIK